MSHILVIGSAHIDAVAVTDEKLDDPRPDVEGRVSFSVGGTAFNIAKNLAQHGHNVQLLTSLKEDSITADLVQAHCRKFNIGLQSILQSESEGGFSGHFAGTSVFKAVCEAAIERVTAKRFEQALGKALRQAALVVVDTNLQSAQIREVLLKAWKSGLSVIVAGVSVSRVKRLYEAVELAGPKNSHLVDVLCVNAEEALALEIVKGGVEVIAADPTAAADLERIARLQVRRFVLTCGKNGYYVYDLAGEKPIAVTHKSVNINPSEISSENGAGDAMAAAIAACHREDYKAWEDNIQQFVAPVLKVMGATTENDLGSSRVGPLQGQKGAWIGLSVSLLAVVVIPIVGRRDDLGFGFTGPDGVLALSAVLGLAAGTTGGRLRDVAAQIGLIDTKKLVSARTGILSAVAGLFVLFAFFVLPDFIDSNTQLRLDDPSQLAAALWFCVALVGGYFTDLVLRQRLELKQLRALAADE